MITSEHIQFKNVSGWIRKAFSSPKRPTWAQKHKHLQSPGWPTGLCRPCSLMWHPGSLLSSVPRASLRAHHPFFPPEHFTHGGLEVSLWSPPRAQMAQSGLQAPQASPHRQVGACPSRLSTCLVEMRGVSKTVQGESQALSCPLLPRTSVENGSLWHVYGCSRGVWQTERAEGVTHSWFSRNTKHFGSYLK